jgi:DNA modification methylase
VRRANPRTHSKKQIRQIRDSIETFGFTSPVLIDSQNRIVAGYGRVEAAKLLRLAEVPTVRLEHLSEAEIRAYVIADNRLAELAGWDPEILAIELEELSSLDLEFDVTVTGFEMPEVDILIQGRAPEANDDADKIPDPDLVLPLVSRTGDLWQLDRHRLLCGDSRDLGNYKGLMAGEKAEMVFVDPPYNVRIDGNVCGKGAIKHSEFAMASGEMSEDEYVSFLGTTLGYHAAQCANGGILHVFMDWRHLGELLAAGRHVNLSLVNLCVWVKTNCGMGSLYRSQHELVLVFKKGTAPHVNNVELGRHGRNRTNVWTYAGINTFRAGRLEELAMHPTVKPVALVADAILDCSRRGGIVLDGFAGSGTTVIAAEKTGRRAFAIEIDPRYVDTAIRRWEAFSGKQAIHAESGLTFANTERARKTETPAPATQGNRKSRRARRGR